MMNALLAGMVVLGLAVPLPADPQTTTTGRADKMMAGGTRPDEKFVIKAAHGNMAEVELGKLAVDNASSDEVKKFARRMVADHSQANDDLKTLAQNKHITLPTDVAPQAKAIHDRLAKLSGASFDRAYMQAMLVDRKRAVDEFRAQVRAGKDADVKSWAAKTLPTLEQHLKLAKDATREVGTSGKRQ